MNLRKLTDYPLYTIPVVIWFTYLFIHKPSLYRGLGLVMIIGILIIISILFRSKNYNKKPNYTGVKQ